MAQRTSRAENLPMLLRIQGLSEPEIQAYVLSLRQKYQQYAMPLEEGRQLIDQTLGTHSLTEILYQTRSQ